MKAHILSLLAASFFFNGCESAEERLDRTNLQSYTNITPGTIVLVQMRGEGQDYTHTDMSGRPRQFEARFGSEYIFQGISYGTLALRRTNDTKTVYFAGRMIQSITPQKK